MSKMLNGRMSPWERARYNKAAATPGGLFEDFYTEFCVDLMHLKERQEETLQLIQRLKVRAKMWKFRDRGFFHQMG